MSIANLSVEQEEALSHIRNGCIVRGATGSGKSRVGIAAYYTRYGGKINTDKYVRMINPADLYIITTAKKRDDLEWEQELTYFYLTTDPEVSIYKNMKITIDSWNNISKYKSVENAYFIFDEQRLVGYGKWVKSFFKIAAKNTWILLTATPGDTWHDYLPVFIANGFFKNKTDFERRHCVYSRFVNYPKIDRYVNEARLIKYRDAITVEIKYEKPTTSHYIDVQCDYDVDKYNYVVRNRWNIYKETPIQNAGEYCLVLRRIVNSSVDRQSKLLDIVHQRKKVIIFYSHDFELEILRNLFKDHYPYTEWNGHKHQELLDRDHWVYLVQYTAGSEGWNCITTDTVVFYSQSYSYKQMVQAAGRIDRRNTPYKDLYYYQLKSSSKIDMCIAKTLKRKKKFSEKGFAPMFDMDKDRKPAPRQLSLFDYDSSKDKKVSGDEKYGNDIGEYCDIYCSWEDPENKKFMPVIPIKDQSNN